MCDFLINTFEEQDQRDQRGDLPDRHRAGDPVSKRIVGLLLLFLLLCLIIKQLYVVSS